MSHPNVWRRLTMLWKLFEVTPAYSARGYRLRHGFLSVSWQSCDPHCLVRPNLTGFDSSVHASWQLEKRQPVGNGSLRDTRAPGELTLGHSVPVKIVLEASGLLQRRDVLVLIVLDKLYLASFAVVDILTDHSLDVR